ncbi:acyl transferase/acyl hydrolase/lysophospholipase [Xylaria intraflava]|nr:acyl transferase/acyl hydrolase/lysophospholipase [Xylaria intraflava]
MDAPGASPASPPPLKILSLDGGGIRGKSSLLVLENIMEAIRIAKGLDAVPRPCECFNLIGGTSTGGIIAIMLGRLGMTVDECIQAYDKFAQIAFTPKKLLPFASPKGAYSAQALEAAIRQTVKQFCPRSPCIDQRRRGQPTAESCQHEDPGFRDTLCTKTVVLAITKDNVDAAPTLFATYDTSTSYENCAIWQVARATSAATTFFKSIKLGRDNVEFIDAGFGYNNPCEVLIEEARQQFPNHGALRVLSIGTGQGSVVEIKDSRFSILQALQKMASTSTAVANRLKTQYEDSCQYYRFNVDRGLQDTTLADWEKTSTISAHTGNYLKSERKNIQNFVHNFINYAGVQDGSAGLHGSPVSHLISHYIPLPRNTYFVGRAETLQRLTQKILTPGDHQRLALYGLGGVGKTQVALRIAYEAKDVYGFMVLWLPAASNAAFQQACTEAVKRLSIQTVKDNPDEDPKELLQHYLNSDKAGKWLLVIDNIDEMSTLFGSPDQPDGIYHFLPDRDSGCILFTTRPYDIAARLAGDNIFEIKGMSYHEARNYLEKKMTTNPIQDDVAVRELLSQLTHLPLAITQAAAYMNRNKISVRQYRELLRNTESNTVDLLSWEFYDKDRYEGSQNAVALTWQVSFNQICDIDPAAAEVLKFISRIEPKGIPQSMLPMRSSKAQLLNAIGTLLGYAFLDIGDGDETYNMHSLVHLATRTWVKARGDETEAIAHAAAHLSDIFPTDDWEKRELWRQYLPHALRFLGEDGYQFKEGQELGYWVGRCLGEDGQHRDAQAVLERVVAIQDVTFAKDHPDRLASQHVLAVAYRANGQVEKAVNILEHVVLVREAALAEDHPDRLASQHALAVAYQANGQVEKSVNLLEHVVLVKAALAEDHPDRLTSQHALAVAYEANGQVEKSVNLLEHVVLVEAALAEGHPSLLASQHALALAYRANGQVEKAVNILEHVVLVREAALAEDHPDRLASQHALALAYKANGQVEKSVNILEHVVLVREAALAEDHPDRLASQHALAVAYQANGQVEKSVNLLEHVVLVEAALAEDHPDRLASQYALIKAYRANGQIQEAAKLEGQISSLS